jgi:ABC-type transporter Mla subunit MlaD
MSVTPEQAQRAENLTEDAITALTKARTAIMNAAEGTVGVDKQLERREDEIAYLSTKADDIRESANAEEMGPHFRNAIVGADTLRADLQKVSGAIEEVVDQLHKGQTAVKVGSEALDELGKMSELSEDHQAAAGQLRKSLTGFGEAMQEAGKSLTMAQERVEAARGKLENLQYASLDTDRGQAADTVKDAHTGVNADATAVRDGLQELGRELNESEPDLDKAVKKGVELANAVRAGMNPERPGERTLPPGSTDQAARHHGTGPGQAVHLDL